MIRAKTLSPLELTSNDQRRVCDALWHFGRDLPHAPFSVALTRSEFLWQEMDEGP